MLTDAVAWGYLEGQGLQIPRKSDSYLWWEGVLLFFFIPKYVQD